MHAKDTEGPQEGIFTKTCKLFFKNLSATYKTNTIKLVIFNSVLMMFIANQDISWDYPFKDVETANRYGVELVPPDIESNFGFVFRSTTMLVNGLALCAVFRPKQNFRLFLLPVILWNIYTIFAILENTFTTVWILYHLEVPLPMYSAVFAVAIFTIIIKTKLTLNVYCFYDYLCYVE